ncbi:hypothetical protein LSM04_000650 [Trypanosoma melophagium]|uniref:uncharacterized protein n=1 Tax=Trypanosoma melophagium TaxID=715481 RepID=UPI00351A90EA|nr:hypothetical protein LSM04_000650 [Trypanosoma melophagium]
MWRRRTLADVARGLRGSATRPGTYSYQRGGKVHARGTNINRNSFNNNNDKKSLWWYPSSWCSSKTFAWLKANAMPLATYQFFLEGSCTTFFAWLLVRERITVGDIEALMRNSNGCTALLADLVDWNGGQHVEGYTIAGHHIDAGTLTAIHTGHNIAAGMLPLQLLILALTYPMVKRVCIGVKQPLMASLQQVKQQSITNVFGNRFAGYTSTTAAAENTPTCHPFGNQQRYRK